MVNSGIPLMDHRMTPFGSLDEESVQKEGEDRTSEVGGGDSDDNLHDPLISR
ncbi:unnamed protein product [Dovyalis caffra]|uniref:Uncharacterized protein n=1 Tax=Dovyalis caffra TaxID=77055 RepID=A0AAV1RWL1_9ROSI|nr:unnamed protein product [Dovyalis caffra]